MKDYDYHALRDLAHIHFPKAFGARGSMPIPLAHGSRDILINALRFEVPGGYVARFYGAWTARPEYALAIAAGMERFLPCGTGSQMISDQARDIAIEAAAAFYGAKLAKKCATAADVYMKTDALPDQARATILGCSQVLDAISAKAFEIIEDRNRQGIQYISKSAIRRLRQKRAIERDAERNAPETVCV